MPEQTPPAVMEEARAAELRRQASAIAAAVLDAIISGSSEADHSTDSMSERAMMAALRPWIPKVRNVLLAKLSSSDPARLEVLMGATSTALESILYYAPGAPLPRYRFEWVADGSLALVPLEAPDAEPVSA